MSYLGDNKRWLVNFLASSDPRFFDILSVLIRTQWEYNRPKTDNPLSATVKQPSADVGWSVASGEKTPAETALPTDSESVSAKRTAETGRLTEDRGENPVLQRGEDVKSQGANRVNDERAG